MFELKANKAPSELRLSLAQWSLNKSLFAKTIDPFDFAHISMHEFEIAAVEFVNQFYTEFKGKEKYWNRLKASSQDAGVECLLIMVDDEGDLGDASRSARMKAVENHYPWVDAAKLLGCHSIRINAFGAEDADTLRSALVEGLGNLTEYSAKEEIHILIENHGLFSSDADFVVDVINQVDNPYLGTLPDFGNWCMSEKWGSIQDGKCKDVYDAYQGVKKFMPYAQGVSAKSYDFNVDGGQSLIDYRKILQMVRSFGYSGHIGIEYEGTSLSEAEGILMTKSLIEEIWQELD